MARRDSSQSRQSSAWFILAKTAWFGLTLLLISIFIAGLAPRYNELVTICKEEPCIPLTLTEKDAQALQEIGLSLETYSVYHLGVEILVGGILVLLAGLIFWRRSGERIGLLAAYTLVLFGLNFMVETDSALLRLYPAYQRLFELLTSLAGVPFILLFYLFPDGHFIPPWTRWFAFALVTVMLIEPLVNAGGLRIPSGQFSQAQLIAYLACLVIGVFAQVYRYRRVSNLTQRKQTKWVVLGLMGLFIAILTWSIFGELFPLAPGRPRLAFNLFIYTALIPVILFFPLSMVFSILRYRLWDIDLVIRRTLIYAALTAVLALVYFGSIIVLQSLFIKVSGQRSEVAIVLSTLAIAALFSPLRRRIQELIDRRFYRQKYDVERTLDTFAASLRDEVDLELLSDHLVTVVEETMQPEHVSLWLRKSDAKKLAG